jgi:hypothetical protein
MPSRNALQLALLAGACAAIPSIANAQTAETGVAPDAGINTTDGNNSGTTPLASSARTSQIIINRSVLDQIPVGSVITSIAFRLDASVAAAWPPAATAFSDYEIRLAKAAQLASNMSATFSDNVVADTEVKVRDGLFGPLAGVFTANAVAPSAEAFGPAITFSTPFYYTGGGLVITIRHSGQAGGVSGTIDGHTVSGIAHAFANGQGALAGLVTDAAPVIRIGFVRDTARAARGVNKMYVGEEFATADAHSSTVNTPLDENPRTFGTIIAPGELDTFGPGTTLTGFSLRNDGSITTPANNAWPTADKIFDNWFLQLSSSQHPVGGMMSDIASNVGPDAVDVYDRPLVVPALAMLPDVDGGILGTPAPFSFVVPFERSFEYRGGPLFMLIRTSGHGQVEQLTTDRHSFSWSQSARSDSAAAVTLDTATTPPIVRFDAEPGVIVPNDRATSNGNSLTSQMLSGTEAVYQVVLSESDLKHIPAGSIIDSFSLRRAPGQGSSWPAADVAALDYDVWVSTAAQTPNTMSATYAVNEGADKVQVRDGALGVRALSYPSAASGPQAYGPKIQFQRGFVYQGGGLCITVRTMGLAGAGAADFTGDLGSSASRAVTTAWDRNAVAGAFTAGPAIKLGYIASGVASGGETTGRRIFDGSRTNQIIYSAASLNDIPPGAKITGMSFRNRVTQTAASYPASNTLLPRFDVALSTAVNTPNTMSTIAANNEGADRVDARTGPLTLPAGTFKDSPILPTNDADEFDFYIDFPQAFFYRGGDLCATIRSESPLNAFSAFDIAAMNSSPLATMRKDDSNADAAVLGAFTAPPIIRFAYTPPSSCLADLNKDGFVNDDDFQIFAQAYNTLDCNSLEMSPGCPADLNFDGVVDDLDFQIFVIAYDALLCP